jgi:hypothetical protein
MATLGKNSRDLFSTNKPGKVVTAVIPVKWEARRHR